MIVEERTTNTIIGRTKAMRVNVKRDDTVVEAEVVLGENRERMTKTQCRHPRADVADGILDVPKRVAGDGVVEAARVVVVTGKVGNPESVGAVREEKEGGLMGIRMLQRSLKVGGDQTRAMRRKTTESETSGGNVMEEMMRRSE